jgi:hypothetical protein
MIRAWLKRIGIDWHASTLHPVGFWVLNIGAVEFTLYARETAMHGALNVFVPRVGYICVKPPTKSFGVWWPWYFYVSPDATPNRASVKLGASARRVYG